MNGIIPQILDIEADIRSIVPVQFFVQVQAGIIFDGSTGNSHILRHDRNKIDRLAELQSFSFIADCVDKPLSFYAFEMLYWCGIREGELLALTPADFDFEKRTVTINKSYQRLNGQDLITTPKTEKSNRVITMPQFLAEEIQDYIKMLYGIGPDDRMFTVTKSYLHREMDRGAKEAGVPRIRIHDIRHSAVSLLIDMGFSATAIADRVGHESIDITYNYAHLFPSKQAEMADKLNMERGN